MARVKTAAGAIEGITLALQIRQDIQIGGRSGAAQYQYTLQDGDTAELAQWVAKLKAALSAMPILQDVSSDAQPQATGATLVIDRPIASRLGVIFQAIDDTIYDAFGQRQVATLFTQVSQYHVIEELDPRFQLDTMTRQGLYVRSSTTHKLVPLTILASVKPGVAPVVINHHASLPATPFSSTLPPRPALR